MGFRKGQTPMDPVTEEIRRDFAGVSGDAEPETAETTIMVDRPVDLDAWPGYLNVGPGEGIPVAGDPGNRHFDPGPARRITGGEFLIKAEFDGDWMTSFTAGQSWELEPIDWPFPPRPRRPYDWQTDLGGL